MLNKIDLEVFKNVIKKSTLNMSMVFTRIHFKDKKMYCSMVSSARDITTIIELKNTLVTLSTEDEVIFNFGNLEKALHTFDTVKKFLDQTEMEVKIYDGADNPRIVLKPTQRLEGETVQQNLSLAMVDEAVLNPHVLQNRQKSDIPYFVKIDLTDEHISILEQTKADAGRYGKIYLKVRSGKLFIDTTDQNNVYENKNLRPLTLQKIEIPDMVSCFDFNNFSNLLEIIQDERSKEGGNSYSIGFGYDGNTESGIMHVFDPEKTEQYFLFSRPL